MEASHVRWVVGFDPGLHATGYGVIEVTGSKPIIAEAGVIRIASEQPLNRRLLDLYESALEILKEHPGSIVAIEELFSHYDRPKTAVLMGHARGVLLLAAAQCNLQVAGYLPTRVKKFLTGSGRASKQQMQRAVQAQFSLAQLPEPFDAADALAVALCHHHAIAAVG